MDLDILEMTSGKELDFLVAEKVMGFTIDKFTFNYDGMSEKCAIWIDASGETYNPKPYSTDISVAWEVANKLGIAVIPQSQEDGSWRWYALDLNSVAYRGDSITLEERNDSGISADTVPEAICKAALLSVMSK